MLSDDADGVTVDNAITDSSSCYLMSVSANAGHYCAGFDDASDAADTRC